MTLDEARQAIVERDRAIKETWAPDAWAMFVVTVAGHIQLSLNRPKHWPLYTLDIPAGTADWLDQFKRGLVEMDDAISALRLAKEMGN